MILFLKLGRKNQKFIIYIKIDSLLEDLRTQIPMDLIVHTKKMHERFLKINSSFCRKIMKERKRLL